MTARAKQPTTKSAPARRARFSFFIDVVAELRKVQWPTRREALRLSILVLVVCVIVGAILGVLDLAFTRLFLLLGG
ncbi:MAG: preprotein translocase subunit SecE [Dehalococcoidia bacterium]